MRAFAYTGNGKADWIEVERPKATGFDAVVRPLMVAPCTSDVHNVAINCLKPNRILGHEGVGQIAEVGELVRDFKVGDVVAIPPVTPDWRTVPSQLGAHQHCSGLITGQKLSNSEDGLFAEFALIRDVDANCARIPDGVSLEAALMAADMLNTGLYGAELAEVQPGDTVVVMGIGPVGLMAVAGARLRGAGRIIAIGSRPHCVELARFYGATDIVNYKDGNVERQVHALTDKKGADCVICAGGGDDALGLGKEHAGLEAVQLLDVHGLHIAVLLQLADDHAGAMIAQTARMDVGGHEVVAQRVHGQHGGQSGQISEVILEHTAGQLGAAGGLGSNVAGLLAL